LGATVISTDEKNTAWKGFGGYQINKYFGVEASYVGLGTVNATGTFLAAPFVTSARVNGLALAAVGTFPITPRFDVFAKLGGFYSKVKSTATPPSPLRQRTMRSIGPRASARHST
jgi:OOP family OmpA-OmpF porin